jgi:hypothetical protein
MSFATFAILVFAFVALILIVSRWGPSAPSASASPGQQPLSPPVGPPCPTCGQPRGQVDRYCRRCGQQLSPPQPTTSSSSQTPPEQQP